MGGSRGPQLRREYASVSFGGQDLSQGVLSGVFISVDFSGTLLRQATLSGRFVKTDFSGADLRGAQLIGSFDGCIFSHSHRALLTGRNHRNTHWN